MQRWMTRLLFSVAACTSFAYAQDGYFDPGFAGSGRKLIDVSVDRYDEGRLLRIQPDGKLLMAGNCPRLEGSFLASKFCATRLHGDGDYDTTFGPGGVGYVRFDRFEPEGFPNDSTLRDMLRLDDGRMLFIGPGAGSTSMLMAVLMPDGSQLDPGVAGGAGFFAFRFGSVYSEGDALALQADGKVLVAGLATGPNGNRDMAVTRFLPDFSVDTSFGNGGYQTVAFDLGGPSGLNIDEAYSLAVQADGRILLGGSAYGPPQEAALTRLLPNGQPDPAFGPDHDGRLHFAVDSNDTVHAIRVDRWGRIVIAVSLAGSQCMVNRLLTDGSQDPAFNASGGVGHPQLFSVPVAGVDRACTVSDLAVQADGTIFVAGSVFRDASQTHTFFMVAKLAPTGALDPTFGIGGKSYGGFSTVADSNDAGSAIAIGNGGAMVAGNSTNGAGDDIQFGIARLTLDRIFADGLEN